ncbi:MAG: aminopeptidase P family protein [Candidatus Sungbacteria bacterium]|nr:aminopeptidase P family protein [Candidatus Sungbacteria bacterium]
MAKKARLIYGSTYLEGEGSNFDLLWLIKMKLVDPHFLIEMGKDFQDRVLLASSLELTRARKEAKNCRVESSGKYLEEARATKKWAITVFLKRHGIKQVELHPLTPSKVMAELKKEGFLVTAGKEPWYPERLVRTSREIEWILETQKAVEQVMWTVRSRLVKAKIKRGVVVERQGPLTSEILRAFIEDELWKRGCGSIDTIVSSGKQTAQPHNLGSGPIRANAPIVFDIYPYSRRTGRFADMTRTFFKGKPSARALRMYTAVREAQKLGISLIRAGVDGQNVHTAIEKFFEGRGFKTDGVRGFGFTHSTGHSFNLWLHEAPSIGNSPCVLPEGSVVTVEPGLYYPHLGMGIRIEDMVWVGKRGCRNLTTFPKDLGTVIIP